MFSNINGVEIDTNLTKDDKIYLIIDEKEYSDTLSQMSIINTLELTKNEDVILFYCVGYDGGYFTAKEFRTAYGYDNTFFESPTMDWQDIVFKLLDDPMIKSCGCDGLLDAYNVLNGLIGMSEIMHSSEYFNNAFILEALNAAIKARNRYCSLNGAEELKPVKMKNNNFTWGMD